MNDSNDTHFHDNERDDPFLDALLDEYINHRKPRELDIDQLSAAIARASFSDDTDMVYLDAAAANAARDISNGYPVNANARTLPTVPPVVGDSISSVDAVAIAPPRTNATTGMRKRIVYAVGAAIAASIMIATGALFQRDNPSKADPDMALQQPTGPAAVSSESETKIIDNALASSSDVQAEPKVAPEPIVPESLGPLPFAQDNNAATHIADELRAQPKPVWLADQAEMLATIDSQFEQMWKRLDVPVSERIQPLDWAERVSVRLVASPLVADDRSALSLLLDDQVDADAGRIAWLNRLISSDAFIAQWADLLAVQYFHLPQDSDQPAVKEAVNAAKRKIADAIRNDQPVVSLWKDFVRLPVQADQDGTDLLLDRSKVSAGIGAWWIARSEGDTHDKARMLLNNWVGQSAACARCHINDESDRFEVSSEDHLLYWSLASLIDKFHITTQEGSLHLRIARDSELFFEKSDGTVAIAVPAYYGSDGYVAINNAQQLSAQELTDAFTNWSDWAETHAAARDNLVDLVWSELFQHRLLTSDELAPNELEELRAFLANQVDSEHTSLRGLIATLVLSTPFERTAPELTASWYLTADAAALKSYRIQQLTFARYAEPKNSNANLGQMVAWLKQTGQTSNPRAVLGNIPSLDQSQLTEPAPASAQEASPLAEELSASQLAWLIESRHPSTLANSLIDQFEGSKLKWDQITNHLYLICLGRPATSDEQRDSQDLLVVSGNSRQLAIARLHASLCR